MAMAQRRKDIQGLRALAVLLVVAGHLFPSVVRGGFIGVDIFFVISGFVITQQMLKSYLTSEKGFLLNFYARRIRRILPAATLVLFATIWATHWLLGPVASNNVSLDAGWASILLSNFHFQNTALNYFATGTQISPLQHYWSLSIEEQFYLLWPTLFILLFAKPISLKSRQILLGLVILLSLMSAIYLSTINREPIFFSSWTRVWELATGALLAVTAKSIHIPRLVLFALITFIITAAFTLPQSMQWPRLTTIPIVLATALMLSRNPRIGSFSVLENRVLTYIGDLSYIIYLWHWPVLVIARSYCGKFGAKEILLVIALTIVLSVTTHHFFENPVRYSRILTSRPAITVGLGTIAIAATAAMLFTLYQG
jgi:peptidoglycan/LPS O-acetylase OafA/YrhL